MQVDVVRGDVPAEWDRYVSAHPRGMVFQTGPWNLAHARSQHRLAAVVAYEGEAICGGAVAILRGSRLAPMAQVMGGVLVDLDDPHRAGRIVSAVLDQLRRYLASERICVCLLAERLPARIGEEIMPYAAPIREALQSAGLIRQDEVLGTYMQDIALDDEKLLASLGANCRRDIRRALRDGAVVEGTQAPEALAGFYEDYRRLFNRKSLHYVRRDLLVNRMARVMELGLVRLFRASYAGVVRNSALVSTVGMPRYLYGATAGSAHEKGVPPTGQVLHYEIMRWQRDRGARQYDWGGSPGPTPEPGHPNYGVWRFKHSFGGTYVEKIGHWRWVLGPVRYRWLQRAIRAKSWAIRAARRLLGG